MKLFICGWRPWSVVGRYNSLITNAQELGHEVYGAASPHLGVEEMTRQCFRDLGVEPLPGGQQHTFDNLCEIKPDAVFGEQYWHCPEEIAAREWCGKFGVPHLVLDHNKNYVATRGPVLEHHKRILNGATTLLTATKQATEVLRGQTKAKLALVGEPQYDLVDPGLDREAVRRKLGVENDYLLALTMTFGERGEPGKGEAEHLLPLLEVADREGWTVVCSPHPTERTALDKLKFPKRGPYLRSLQDQGVSFVSDFPAGEADGVRFEQCSLYDLMGAADGVVGSSETAVFPAYASGKNYFTLGEAFYTWWTMPNQRWLGGGYRNLIREMWCRSTAERDAVTEREYFYKLDGRCWERILREAGDDDDLHGDLREV